MGTYHRVMMVSLLIINIIIHFINGHRLTGQTVRLPNDVYRFEFGWPYNHSNTDRVSNLIGKGLPCRGRRCRIEAGLTRI